MLSPGRQRQSCKNRDRYPTHAAAYRAVQAECAKPRTDGCWFTVYACKFCGGFHWGIAATPVSPPRKPPTPKPPRVTSHSQQAQKKGPVARPSS